METESVRLMRLLQHADSAFPSGAVSFSSGLEGLRNDGLLCDANRLSGALRELLQGRFLGADRILLAAAWQAAPGVAALCDLDRLAEAATPAREARDASSRAGAALLGMHRRLGTEGAAGFAEALAAGRAHAHLPVVQGLVWRGAGLTVEEAVTAAAHAMIAAALSAGLRLGVVGHVAAQQLHGELRAWLAPRLATPVPPLDELCPATPLLDIAAMRHETQEQRLFAS